ncbi:MAG: glycosyltransferase family 2 protein [Candidatus Omnitrophica bacterium]|nr:glycosyltransferase family 2 protein [Candidatus Omnitrophota bacterium]MBU4487889.1 glycosyltransferase family 2 protein [Candidatus Omnitrophota bacterium]MCG2704519.1 glycosyltransferase family 2 protein [Candidatus Omnitrophota bacterium]
MIYSVVVPFFNEEESIRPLYESLTRVMESLHGEYELIFVNDGSTDNTKQLLGKTAAKDRHVAVLNNAKKMGQTASLKIGFEKARGDIVVSMDGDMQNDPNDIPKLATELKCGYDFVCGWRYMRKDPASKKIASWFGNLVQKAVFKSHLHDISCTLRVYTKDSIKVLPLKREGAHRFIPYLLMMKGKRPSEVKVNHLPRRYGRTKYGFSRSFKVAYDFLTLIFNRKSWT